MNPTLSLFVAITLFTVMLALGLNLRAEALLAHWRRAPGLPLRVLLASCLLVPLLALLALQTPWSASIAPPARYAIALMALCPSAPLALRKAGQSGGDQQLAALLQVSAALAAIVTVPLLGLAFKQSFAVIGWDIRPEHVALQVGRVQVLPLLLGLWLNHQHPGLSARLQRPLRRLANLLLLTLLLAVLVKTAPLLLSYVPSNLPALVLMALMALAALGLGRWMAAPQPSHATTTALVTAMRNPGLALLFASSHGEGLPGLKLGILVYVLITLLLSAALLRLAHHQQP